MGVMLHATTSHPHPSSAQGAGHRPNIEEVFYILSPALPRQHITVPWRLARLLARHISEMDWLQRLPPLGRRRGPAAGLLKFPCAGRLLLLIIYCGGHHFLLMHRQDAAAASADQHLLGGGGCFGAAYICDFRQVPVDWFRTC